MASLSLGGLEPHRAPLASASEIKSGYGHINLSGFWFIWYLLCGFWTVLKISVTVLPWWVTECSGWSGRHLAVELLASKGGETLPRAAAAFYGPCFDILTR